MSQKGFSKIWLLFVAAVVIAAGVLVSQQLQTGAEEGEKGTKVLKDLNLARDVLVEYFSLLNEGRYNEAVQYHGSGYDYMNTSMGYESELDSSNPNNYAELLRRGCLFLKCLKVKKVIDEEENSPGQFKFTVQFAENDGSLFERSYYCCGEEPPKEGALSPQTEFDYIVEKEGDAFRVRTPILYVP